MESTFKVTGLTDLYLYQDPQDVLKNQMGNFNEADCNKYYARSLVEYYKTVTIASRSRQIRSKLQERTKTSPLPGLNISPAKEPSITSGVTQEADEN